MPKPASTARRSGKRYGSQHIVANKRQRQTTTLTTLILATAATDILLHVNIEFEGGRGRSRFEPRLVHVKNLKMHPSPAEPKKSITSQEAMAINTSLTALGKVVLALASDPKVVRLGRQSGICLLGMGRESHD